MPTAVAARTGLDIHGLHVLIHGDWPEVIEAVRRDFLWFEAPPGSDGADLEIVVRRRPPDWEAFEGLRAAFVTPRDVVYRTAGRTIMDHLGRAVSEIDHEAARLTIQGTDEEIVHDALYYYLVGEAGSYLEGRGLPRLHGLGLSGAQGGVAVLLPSGGGKSTLAVRALREEGVKLLSDDSPLLDRHGRLHPFPLRIAINSEDAASMPEGSLRHIERVGLHPKLALDTDAFADRIERTPQPLRHIVIGQRSPEPGGPPGAAAAPRRPAHAGARRRHRRRALPGLRRLGAGARRARHRLQGRGRTGALRLLHRRPRQRPGVAAGPGARPRRQLRGPASAPALSRPQATTRWRIHTLGSQ